MAAIGPALPWLSAGFSLLSGLGGMASANAQAEEAAQQRLFEQRQANEAAKDEILAATQEEVIRRRELNDTLSTIDAIRASRGLTLTSPTAGAIRKNIGKIAGENIRTGNINRLTRVSAYKQQANFAGQAADSALKSGRSAGGVSLLKGLAGAGSTLYSHYND